MISLKPLKPLNILKQPLVHFLLIGALLAGWQYDPAESLRVVLSQQQLDAAMDRWQQQHQRAVDDHALASLQEKLIRDEVLLAEARARGFDRLPVVQTRLQQLAEFLQLSDGSDSPGQTLQVVISNGLGNSDPLVREYMLSALRETLKTQLMLAPISHEQIAAYYREQGEQFNRPGRLRLSHVYIGGLSDRAYQRALTIADKLNAGVSLDQAVALGDPFHNGHHLPLMTERQLAASLGGNFARQSMVLSPGQWSPPIASSYGYHLVRVAEKQLPSRPPLSDVEASIARQLSRQQQMLALDQRIDQLVASYRVELPYDELAADSQEPSDAL